MVLPDDDGGFYDMGGTKKEHIAVCLVAALFIAVSAVSMLAIREMRGNARVVNYAGIVRGATQKLVKEELTGAYYNNEEKYGDDTLIARLDGIIANLSTGAGDFGLVRLNDKAFMDDMVGIRESWAALKAELARVRAGKEPKELYDMSQDYFQLCDHAVGCAEEYSERMVSRMTLFIIGVDVVFVGFGVALGFIVAAARRSAKRADALSYLAYTDSLTGVGNRAGCGRTIARIKARPAAAPSVGFVMIDMNNLKLSNDSLGHQGGDKILARFGGHLKECAEARRAEVFRYGGDEFLAVFEGKPRAEIDVFISELRRAAEAGNAAYENDLEKVSFADGSAFYDGSVEPDVDSLIFQADKNMYENKLRMKRAEKGEH
jgi:diguanylate cyclase (GGDEF)-like protein